MQKFILSLVILAGLFQSCDKTNTIELKNELKTDRTDAQLVLSREEIKSKLGEIKEGFVPTIISSTGEVLASQTDDLDKDGKWDEFVFVCDFKAEQTKTFTIKLIPADKLEKFTIRTNVRLGVGNKEDGFKGVEQAFSPKGFVGIPLAYQSESVGWENDKMAFRNYFDCRNAKDLFGKLKPAMIMDKVGITGNYHKLADWGMDVLHVGPSLGSGGLALLHKDSLYRLGSTEVFEFQLISKGAVRSIFDLKFKGWNVDGKNLDATERITVWAGKYAFQSDVTINGLEDKDELVIGIVTSHLKNKPFSIESADYTAIATHDTQSMIHDYLGLSVMVKKADVLRIADAPEVNFDLVSKDFAKQRATQAVGETHYITSKIENSTPVRHYFYATWEKENSKWAKQENFANFLKQEATEYSSPIQVSIK